jgi:Outer membrane protein and related peptidoglycan-associated (lipo)proteins
MKKKIFASTLILAFAGSVFANQNVDISKIQERFDKLKEKHALECSPEEYGMVESYLESLKIEDNQSVDSLRLAIKIEDLLTKIEKNINSDKDNDGIPCYKEIELGLNPNIPDVIEKVKVTQNKEPEKLDIGAKEKEAPKTYKSTNAIIQPVRVHFYLNSSKIKKEYLPYLNVVAKYLKTHPDVKVKIKGYTDNIGSKKYNDKLALKRAKAVKQYLVKLGVSPNRITIDGVGKSEYIVSNNNELDRFTNRRAEFYIINLAE